MRVALGLALVFLWAGAVHALEKEKLIRHIRESNGVPAQVEISLGDPSPSELSGFRVLDLEFKREKASQKRRLYLADDGVYYFMAEVKDLRVDPDSERLKKMDLQDVSFLGGAKAKVTLVEYSDLQCPYCSKAHLTLKKELQKKYGNKVRWVLKSFPLTQIHPWAEPAAVAISCAKKQKPRAYWDMGDAFFENQKDVTKENVRERALEYAKKSKLDLQKFTDCYDKQEVLEEVRKDVKEAEALGVNSTPSFFVNGHPVIGFGGMETISQVIDSFLSGKHD